MAPGRDRRLRRGVANGLSADLKWWDVGGEVVDAGNTAAELLFLRTKEAVLNVLEVDLVCWCCCCC